MSTFQTLLDSYGDLANRYAALEDENAVLKAERDALKEEVERCEACIRFWKKGASDLLQELEER